MSTAQHAQDAYILQAAWFHAKHTLEFQSTKPIAMLPCFL